MSPVVHKTVHPASNHMNVVVDYSMPCLNVNIECPRTFQKETFSSENLSLCHFIRAKINIIKKISNLFGTNDTITIKKMLSLKAG